MSAWGSSWGPAMGAGVVMNDGVRADLTEAPFLSQVAVGPIEAVFAGEPFACELAPQILASIGDSPVHVEISP